MSDLIERLRKWGEGESLTRHFLGTKSAREDCAEAATALAEAEAEIVRLRADLVALRKRLTPRQIRYAPKDGRLLVGVERPPMEDKTFFYDIVWDERRNQFVVPFVGSLNGATHFLDPKDMIGIVWPYEIARQRRAALSSPHATKGETG